MVEVAVDPADAQVVEEQLLAGQRGKHLHDLVALGEAPEDRRQPAQVERQPAHEERVARDPIELPGEHADVLRAARHLEPEELLRGEHGHRLAEHRGDVLERVAVADGVVPVAVLADLLDATVEVAQDRIEIDDTLAVHLEHDTQHAVR